MIKTTNKTKIITFIFFVYVIFSPAQAFAKIYEEIIVNGNERLSVETIIMFSGLKTGKEISNKDLNLSIKKLYKSN